MENTARKKIFYGWFCVLGAFFVSASMGIQYSVFSLFVIPVTEELGCTRAQFTMILTIFSMISMLESPIIGRILTKVKVRTLLACGAIGHILVYVGYSFSHSLGMFYACAALLGISCQMSNAICINHVIGKWFIDKKGLATGIAFCGSGICLLFMSPFIQSIIEGFGWRWGYRTIAIGIVVFMSLALILIREDPESMGLKPLGWDKQTTPAAALKGAEAEVPGITFKDSLKTPAFYLAILGLILMMIIPQAINPNLSPLLQSAGYTAMAAANVLSLSNMLQIPAKIILGIMFDKIKAYGVAVSEGVIAVLAPLCCIACMTGGGAAWVLIPLIIAYAFNYSLINMALPATAAAVFGRKDFTMFVSLGVFSMLFANTFAGRIVAGSFDKTGSYMGGVWTIVVIGVVSTLLLLAATKLSRRWMAPAKTETAAEQV